MTTIDTVVIGAGHAGLAVSRLLTEAGRDHVVARPRPGRRALAHRALGLAAPADAELDDPAAGLATTPGRPGRLHERRPASSSTWSGTPRRSAHPSSTGTTVQRARPRQHPAAIGVVTDRGTWRARHVVIATGPHGVPHVPAGLDRGRGRSPRAATATPRNCRPAACSWSAPRRPACRSPTSSTAPGREVVLAVGRHTRMPRRYRGMDIFWWLERTGRLARTIDEVPDPAAARREPSMQLVGRATGGRATDLDLVALQARGVRLVGRFDGMTGTPSTLPARPGRERRRTPTHGCTACSTRSTTTSPAPA